MNFHSLRHDGEARSRYRPGRAVDELAPLPSALASSETMAPAPIAFSDTRKACEQAGDGIRILVVEDSFMLVSTLELAFASLGWTMVGPATRLPKALAMARTESFDAVLLDVNLGGFMSWDVAAALKARGIPFVLSTGYELDEVLPDFLRGSPFIRKPYSIDDLERSLLNVISCRAIDQKRMPSTRPLGSRCEAPDGDLTRIEKKN